MPGVTLKLQADDPRTHQIGRGRLGDLVSFAIEMADGTIEVFREVGVIIEINEAKHWDTCTILWYDFTTNSDIVPEGLFIHARAK